MRDVLNRLLSGELNLEEAETELRRVQLTQLGGGARLDVGRMSRRGLPEVVLASGKSPEEVATLVVALAREQGQGLASRLEPAHEDAVRTDAADYELRWYRRAVLVQRPGFSTQSLGGRVAIVTAGTSDLDAADEVRMMVEACGHEPKLVADVGVAGLHRLAEPLADLLAWDPDVFVVAAGMDGVLPGVVAGLVDRPVIGLPVPNGYGAGGEGHAALLTMLQSCSTGLTVVNIGNGIGAGAAAVVIAARAAAGRRPRPAPATRRSG